MTDSDKNENDPGAGKLAALAIREAPTLERARAIFDAHLSASNRRDTPDAAYALMMRMGNESEDGTIFATELHEKGIDLSSYFDDDHP